MTQSLGSGDALLSPAEFGAVVGGLCGIGALANSIWGRKSADREAVANSKRADSDSQRADADSARAAFDSWTRELRTELDETKAELRKAKVEIADLVSKVTAIEGQVGTLQARLHLAYDYIRILVDLLARSNVPIPGPPQGLDVDLHINLKAADPE